jgi:hypothetical protein
LALPVDFADFQPHYLLLAMQVRDIGGKSRRAIARRPLVIFWTAISYFLDRSTGSRQ